MLNPKVRPEHSDNTEKPARQPRKTENPVGMRIVTALNGRSLVWLAGKTGISASTLGDYVKKGISRADYAVQIARHLDVTVEWLMTGGAPSTSNAPALLLASADEAEWVSVSEYDLRELTDTGLGEPKNQTPMRRDWLATSFGHTNRIWVTRLLSDYKAADLEAGNFVLCADIKPAELLEGQLCLFRMNGGLIVARFSYQSREMLLGTNAARNDLYITSAELAAEDAPFYLVARILGRLLGRL